MQQDLIPMVPLVTVTRERGFPSTGSTDLNLGSSLKAQKDAKEIERLRSVCALYEQYCPLWDFYLAAFEGGPSFTTEENLYKHQRENQDDFADRVKRMHYTNYCEPLTTFFTDFIYAETIQRDGGKNQDFFEKFTKDVNKKGDDVTAFMSEAADDMQIFGMAYGLVDAPPLATGEVVTKVDQAKVSPYWVLIRPSEIVDWGVDEFDKFTYVRRKQQVVKVDELGQRQNIQRFTEWSQANIKITDVSLDDKQPTIISVVLINNSLGVVPIEVLRYKRSKLHPFMGNSFLRDLAPNNREVMNLTSLLQEFLYRQCFNLLALEMEGDLPRADQEDGDAGTSNMLTYPKGAKIPQYIAPSSEPATRIAEERRTIVAEMYRRAAQDTVNELFNGGGSSGFSKAQSFRTTVPRIASRAENLEKFEIKMFTLAYKYMGWEWDGSIKYKDHYEITNLADALGQMSTLFKDLLMPSETFIKEEMLRMVHLYDGKISPDKMAKIYKELESFDWSEWVDTMKLSFLGTAARTPDAAMALGEPPGTNVPAGTGATKGKDTATTAATAQKPGLNTEQVAATSSKTAA